MLWKITGWVVGAIAVMYTVYALFLYWLVNCASPNVRC